MLTNIKKKFSILHESLASKLDMLFGKKTIDQSELDELRRILLQSDIGVATTDIIMQRVKNAYNYAHTKEGASLKNILREILHTLLEKPVTTHNEASIIILVGINGSGKTTSIAKLAHYYGTQKKKVLVVAADTYRAAALDQLKLWINHTGAQLIHGNEGQDPASLVFTGCKEFLQKNFDILLIDTAGRLQTKINLLHEFAKLRKVIEKHISSQKIQTLLTIDSTLGQNSFEQAKLLKDCTPIDGIILTKADITGKGGIIFAIINELDIPIVYITYGEQLHQLKQFDRQDYISNLLGEST